DWRMSMSVSQGAVALLAGAGRGIGAATATLLAARGARVILIYRQNHAAAQQTVERIRQAGGSAHAVAADVRDPSQVAPLVDDLLYEYGRLDILVCSASAGMSLKPFVQMARDEFLQSVANELGAVFTITQAVL